MARKTSSDAPTMDEDVIDETLVTSAPDDWEFNTVSEESPIGVVFETPGDVFVGKFVEKITITPENGKDEPFDLFTFRARDERLYAVNSSYKLERGMQKVEPGQWTRITYIKDVKTNAVQPMKDFRIDVRTN